MRIAYLPTFDVMDSEPTTADDHDSGSAGPDGRRQEQPSDETADGDDGAADPEAGESDDSPSDDDTLDVPAGWLHPEDREPLDPDELGDPAEHLETGDRFGHPDVGGSRPRAGTASGSSTPWNRLVVVGEGATEHTYEIGMQDGGELRKARLAGGNDRETRTSAGTPAVEGSLWHWNADSYAYTGEIAYVEADGPVAFHVPGGLFASATEVHVDGRAGGPHRYALATNSADIDPVPGTTESTDTDHAAGSEQRHTADRVTGEIGGHRHDSYDLGAGDPLQYVAVTRGHLRVSRRSSRP